VSLHRSCGLRSLTAEIQIELADVLNVGTVLTNQDDPFRDPADCVHDSSLLSELTAMSSVAVEGWLPPVGQG